MLHEHGEPGPRVLVVDDDETVLRVHARILAAKGYRVETALNGEAAIRALGESTFDMILSDIDMPGTSGIQLLERVRAYDLDVPVVMITGSPSLDTAIAATEYGALRYLVKPVAAEALVKVVADAVCLHRMAMAKRQALELMGGVDRFVGDRAGLAASFDRALKTLYIAYQPVVCWSKQTVVAYEALLRCREPSLPHPGAILDAAERLGRIHELGRAIRTQALEPIAGLPEEVALFLNLHPHDLEDEVLFASGTPLANASRRIVLEVTERASLDGIKDVRARAASLRKLGFRLAIDDLGAGYAGLTSFALLEPQVVKLDMGLIRNLHREPIKQTIVRTMVSMSVELGIMVLGEGIETIEERDELARCGCDLMQGYLFARPGEPFPAVQF